MILRAPSFRLLEMGCFGIGVSRLLAAALEHGLSDQEGRLIWPPAIAPYHICVACLAQVLICNNRDACCIHAWEFHYSVFSPGPFSRVAPCTL